MTGSTHSYQGDAALDRLLQQAGAPMDVEAVRGLVRGVLSAPPGRDPDAWCLLVTPEPSRALVRELQALKAEIAAAEAERAPPPVAERLSALRAQFEELGIDGFVVPRADEYQNEYVPTANERLAFVSGFTGSAGMAIVLADRAAIFVDGRYTLQVTLETDPALFERHHLIEDPPEAWVERTLKPGQVLGYDAWLMTPAQVERFREAAGRAGATIEPVAHNPLDAAWAPTRPAAPLGPVRPHPLEFAGKSSVDKRHEIAGRLAEAGRDALVVTAPDSIAWLLNIRGADVPHTPLPLGFALLDREGHVDLFMDRRKLVPGLQSHLGNEVALRQPEDFGPALAALGGKSVQFDPATAASWIADRLADSGATAVRAADPIILAKAVKNAVELEGARKSHRRDGAAMVKFLHWLDDVAPAGELTEIGAADRLEEFRAEGELFQDISFASISSSGPNGAIIHYHPTPATDRRIESGLYLIDSGAQYLDGTTDITRTVAVGETTAEMRDRYTRVLKGHIALATARFPAGTTGPQLDVLARLPLWRAGVNYDHGTGHGVGSYLGVHEGPVRIATVPNTHKLAAGMILSNEPGYYKPGGFGCRIENLVAVVPIEIPGAEREMLGFETITLCPIDKRPIEPALLDAGEIAWLDAYHAAVHAAVAPLIGDPDTLAWLDRATAPLGA
jgi:Xaa-Pro aminopeptidase